MSQIAEQVPTFPSLTLRQEIAERISREGPITFRDWMDAALYHPSHGYYVRSDRQRWGREGDYRTSPERSDLFAATFARYFATLYDHLDQPPEWMIVECGAGNGVFALGVLRTLQHRFPEIFNVTHYVIDEVSDAAGGPARQKLLEFGDRVQFTSLRDLGRISRGIIFSNELVDAFPVHRLIGSNGELNELYVTLGKDEDFVWSTGCLSNARLATFCRDYKIELRDGQVLEVNLALEDWLSMVSRKLEQGYLITVDYGTSQEVLLRDPQRERGTLRGYYRHQFVANVLEAPGEYDLTSNVNWTHMIAASEKVGLTSVTFGRQDHFLMDAGLIGELTLQSELLTGDAERLTLSTTAREMILPGGMACNFQVLVQKRTGSRLP